jgi:hypothetical protein
VETLGANIHPSRKSSVFKQHHPYPATLFSIYNALGAINDPIIKSSVRAPLASNAKIGCGSSPPSIPIFASNAVEMDIPYAYWNFGGSSDSGDGDITPNHTPILCTGYSTHVEGRTDAVALAVLISLD